MDKNDSAMSSHPLKIILTCPYFEMQFHNTQIHTGISHHRKKASGTYTMPAVFHSRIFNVELLLIHSRRSLQCRAHSFLKPFGRGNTRVAHILHAFAFMFPARIVRITERNHACHLLFRIQGVSSFHLPV